MYGIFWLICRPYGISDRLAGRHTGSYICTEHFGICSTIWDGSNSLWKYSIRTENIRHETYLLCLMSYVCCPHVKQENKAINIESAKVNGVSKLME